MTRSFDDEFDRRLEHEPDYRGHHSPAKLDGAGTLQVVLGVIPSSYATDIIERLVLTGRRCSTCSILCDGERCATCTVRDARGCGCGSFVYADESHCTECGEKRAA